MENEILNFVKGRVKNWWVSLIIGILGIFLGIWCLLTPDKTLVALSYAFIFVFILSGVAEIFFAVTNRKYMRGWGWFLASGIIEFLLGILLLLLPINLTTVMLVYLLGFWIMFRSIWTIGEAVDLQQSGVRGWGWFLVIGIICVILSFIYLISPMIFKGSFAIVFASIALLVYGIYRIGLSIQLRSVYKEIKEFENE